MFPDKTKFTWDDYVQVIKGAPAKYYKNGYEGFIASINQIENKEIAKEFKLPIGSITYTVEDINGQDCEIPEIYLEEKKYPYKEGDWFMLPLGNEGFVVGLVARKDKSGGLFSYFFSPRIYKEPKKEHLELLTPDDAIDMAIHGCQGFIHDKTCKVIGAKENFQRKDWPMPKFLREDSVDYRFSLITYDENTLEEIVELEKTISIQKLSKYPINQDELEETKKDGNKFDNYIQKISKYFLDGLAGYGVMEIRLTKICKELESKK